MPTTTLYEELLSDFRKRLDRAFRALRRRGIFARRNFLCCQGCGCSDIAIRYEDKEFSDKHRAWLFYHQQDESNLGKGFTYITWGHRDDDAAEETLSALATEICGILNKFGLNTEHDGTSSQRIKIVYPMETD